MFSLMERVNKWEHQTPLLELEFISPNRLI
jgi:hypothetical protein